MPEPLLAASRLDKDPAHRFGRRGEEVSAVLPALVIRGADEPQVGLVHQRRGLERLAGLLPRQALSGQLPQLVVDQRQELLGRPGLTLFDGGEDARHVRHRQSPDSLPGGDPDTGPSGIARCGPMPAGIPWEQRNNSLIRLLHKG